MLASRTKHSRRNLLIVLITCLIISLGGFLFWQNNHKVTSAPSTSAQEDKAAVKRGISQKNSNSEQGSGSDKQTNSNSASGNVASPQGNFVSSHHVTLGSTIESVCVTTKGAVCEITFSQNGTTKTLGKKTVDSNGSVTWLWTPNSVNLAVGTWEINAVASLNGSQSTAKDPMNLEITQ